MLRTQPRLWTAQVFATGFLMRPLGGWTLAPNMQKLLTNTASMSVRTASDVMTVCLFIFMGVQPLFGALSDRIGRRSNMLLFGALGAIGTLPIFKTLQDARGPVVAAR
jgi:MHS family alpha-ketoglutarate permease-like MFS transporter